MIRFSFIGGTKRGYILLQKLIEKNLIPAFAIILKEDDHETEKYSEKISGLLNDHKIQNSIKRKLTEADHNLIRSSELDFILVYGWRTMIDPDLNKFLKYGMIAIHHSLLPKYRGFAPVQWALINGETETGVSLFQINGGEIDSGKIIAQEKIAIEFSDHGPHIEEKATNTAIKLFLKYFEDQITNTVIYKQQNENDATYTCKRIPEDGKINWHQTSLQIYNLIRALSYPNTEAYCLYNDDYYFINKARAGNNNAKNFAGKIPGRVYKIYAEGIEVICGEGTLLIELWKKKGDNSYYVPSENIKSLSITLK
ncbi:MAG: formyltransferase family protein [Ignavibacteria bacterium]